MRMRTIVTGLGVAAALALVALLIVNVYRTPAPQGTGQGCTREAKLCPDGSYVGRSGPNCEFAECPQMSETGTPVPESGTVQARIGEAVRLGGISITPIAVLDDSRCAAEVQCIWAGTVHVRATLTSALGTTNVTFELGQAFATEAETITLTEVAPSAHAGVAIAQSDYILTFDIKKK